MNPALQVTGTQDPDIFINGARACVLVVDDQPLNIALVKQFLSGDYAVLTAGSGTAALALCRAEKPDLILLDVMMPGMSGHEVCKRLADNLETRHIPVIFITSNYGPDEEAHGLSLGAVDFIAKPLNPVVLKARVRTQLMLKRQSDQLRENEARLLHAACVSNDAREAIKEYQRQLEHIAYYDPLTGLPNRAMLSDSLAQAKVRAQRRNMSLAIVYLDLDGFKPINDRLGHETGDQLLVGVAHAMRDALRAGDCIARFGGDEFVVFIADLEQPGDCVPVLQRLLDAARTTVHVGELALSVSASLGVSMYPQDDCDTDQLVRHADQAMYLAKQNGKNQIQFYDPVKEASIKALSGTQEEIRLGIRNREFVLYYQPKVNMKSGAVVGAEALIRWNHATRGLLAPALFLPAIENHALSIALGEWVIQDALHQMAEWSAAGHYLPVSVNVGSLQLQQSDFLQRLQSLLAAAPSLPAGSLTLEILETSALSDLQRMTGLIEDCRRLGVDFALDDFGTGYSSLSYLKALPAKTLKIDQTFVRDMSNDPDDRAIVKGVVGLAHAFGREVIAEGIEHVQDGETLLRLGCELGQGYCIARPMPAHAMPEWARNWQTPARWKKQIYVPHDSLFLLGTMVQHAPVGICVIDTHGVFRDVNAQYCGLYGYLAEELVGQLFTIIFEPAEQQRILALHDAFMNEGGELAGSWRAVRKDGGRIKITTKSIRVPGNDDQYNRLVYVIKSESMTDA
jgi:diguanylate cyclase (GGDEF)-like protein/PAS domain S-box-containing protein